MNCKLEASYYYINYDPLDQRLAYQINSSIGQSRLGENMKFVGYGQIDFDENDNKHQFLNIVTTDDFEFKKGKVNCLVYNLEDTKRYDKIVIYLSLGKGIGKLSGNYGLYLADTNNNVFVHHAFIPNELSELLIALSNDMLFLV